MAAKPDEYNFRMDATDTSSTETIDFDPDALRDKYRDERDKRLRADGNEQYIEVVGDFARYLDDPYVEPIEREPLTDEVEVVIIGGGFGGLLAGARLREAGIDDIRVIEKGGDFGGTWYWNRYPGAMCDVESYIYLPLLEEIGYIPKEKYTHGARDPRAQPGDRRALRPLRNACFQTEVTEMRWDEDDGRWIVSTNRGDEMRARFVVHGERPAAPAEAAGHPRHRVVQGPHVPHQPVGLRLHRRRLRRRTSTGLADKRVGIIGTGATAVQCVPHLGAAAKHLFVFQRTPSSIDVRDNRPTDPEWASAPRAGLAEAADGELQQPRRRASPRPRTSSTTAGPTSSASC